MLKRIVSVTANNTTIEFNNEHYVLNKFSISPASHSLSTMKYTIGEKYLWSSLSSRTIDMEFTIIGDTLQEVTSLNDTLVSVFVPLTNIELNIGDYTSEVFIDSTLERTDNELNSNFCRTYKVSLKALYPYLKNPILQDSGDLYIQDTIDGEENIKTIGEYSSSLFSFINPSSSPASDFSLKATLTAAPWSTQYRLKNGEHIIHITFPDTMHPQIGDYFYYNSEDHTFELVIAANQTYPLEEGVYNLLNYIDSSDILIYNYPGENEIVLQYYNTTNSTWDNVQGNYEFTAYVEVLEV